MNPKNFKSSVKTVLLLLENEGDLCPSEISIRVNLSMRTIHYALRILVEYGLVEKRSFLEDMRHKKYSLKTRGLQSV